VLPYVPLYLVSRRVESFLSSSSVLLSFFSPLHQRFDPLCCPVYCVCHPLQLTTMHVIHSNSRRCKRSHHVLTSSAAVHWLTGNRFCFEVRGDLCLPLALQDAHRQHRVKRLVCFLTNLFIASRADLSCYRASSCAVLPYAKSGFSSSFEALCIWSDPQTGLCRTVLMEMAITGFNVLHF